MKLIAPISVDETVLVSSNLTEDDYPEWDNATTYAAADRVIVLATHKVYLSVISSNLGNDPTTDDGTNWTEVGATNKWKAFDNRISDRAVNPLQISYDLAPSKTVSALSVHGVVADSVTVTVIEQGSEATVFEETKSLVDNSGVEDWWDYFFQPIDRLEDLVFTDLLAFDGDAVAVSVAIASGNAELGQLVLGYQHTIGITITGVDLGITDYSVKETDEFGNAFVLERSYSVTVDFPVSIKTLRSAYIRRLLASRRAVPSVYFAGADMEGFGTIAFGYFNDFYITLQGGERSDANIKVESLT